MFRAILDKLMTRVEGALCVSLMGTDGIPIEEVRAPTFAVGSVNTELVCAEYAALQRRIAKTNDGLDLPGFRELVVTTDPITVIVGMINEDYFLVLLMEPRATGRARYEVRKAQIVLEREMA